MNKQQEALKLALEALEETLRTLDDENAKPGGAISDTIWYSEHETLFDYLTTQITAIREALADSALDRMADNARELGLDYAPIVEQVEDFVGMGHGAWDMVDPKELAKGFHEALAEPPCKTGSQCTNKCQQCEQPAKQQSAERVEPVACKSLCELCVKRGYDSCANVAQTTPIPFQQPAQPSKPWVGLDNTDLAVCDTDGVQLARYWERVLREKNT